MAFLTSVFNPKKAEQLRTNGAYIRQWATGELLQHPENIVFHNELWNTHFVLSETFISYKNKFIKITKPENYDAFPDTIFVSHPLSTQGPVEIYNPDKPKLKQEDLSPTMDKKSINMIFASCKQVLAQHRRNGFIVLN
ncbi:MAG: hypothetical protein FWC51_01445 [Proteobacteria bacterium]|nr:hypothetical protein [Pseudomonadota bacterium]